MKITTRHAVLSMCQVLLKSLFSINLLSLHKNLWDKYFYHPYFDKRTEAWRGWITFPRSHNPCCQVGFKCKQSGSRIGVSHRKPLTCLISLNPTRILYIISIKQIHRRSEKISNLPRVTQAELGLELSSG